MMMMLIFEIPNSIHKSKYNSSFPKKFSSLSNALSGFLFSVLEFDESLAREIVSPDEMSTRLKESCWF